MLGQWREYGDKGRGLSIGLKMEWFERLCEKNKLFRFSKVLYSRNEEGTLSTITRYAEEKEWRLIVDDEETRKDYDDWRTLYNWKDITMKQDIKGTIYELLPNALEFSVRDNKIVSYLDLKYDIDTDDLPIQNIIIGPNCKVSESDIYFLLEFFGFDGNKIQVQRSKSSYHN